MTTFSDFKKSFYSRVTDAALFDCGEINLLKVVLDGLKVDYVSRGNVRAYLFYPAPLRRFFEKRAYKANDAAAVIQKLEAAKHKTHLISDMGRIVRDNANVCHSLYFDNISTVLKKETTFVIADKINAADQPYDMTVQQALDVFASEPADASEILLRKNIIATYARIKKSGLFTIGELANIQFACHKFFYDYKAWHRLLNYLPALKTCYFICHYHKEGQIHALKQNSIQCIELQHGLISAQDIFYVFPDMIKPVRKKALFADKILVYGPYWKDVLLAGAEYSADEIENIGYYLFDEFIESGKEKELTALIGTKKVILVTTQTFLHTYFIDFVKTVAQEIEKNALEVIILVKPHPAEKPEVYTAALSAFKSVVLVQNPLPLLFKKAEVHVSIYSTTLYDALRYGLTNYVFKPKVCEDYVDEIISAGIAKEIINPADILTLPSRGANTINAGLFYEKFNKNLITA